MTKIRTFFYSLKNSIISPLYYKKIATARMSFSLKYLAFLLFVFSLITSFTAVLELTKFLPKVPQFTTDAREYIYNFYPEDLVINIENGTLSTNVQEPYYIDIKDENGINIFNEYENLQDEEDFRIDHLIAIDTNASIENYEDYNSVVLVTDKLIIYPDNNTYQVMTLDDIEEDITITRQKYLELANEVTPYLNYLEPLVKGLIIFFAVLAPFIITLFNFSTKLFYLLVLTLALYAISSILNLQYKYSQLYKMGIHGLTTPIIITYALKYIPFNFPFLFTLIFLMWMFIVLLMIKQDQTLTKPSNLNTSNSQI